jgi:hypothetical protein
MDNVLKPKRGRRSKKDILAAAALLAEIEANKNNNKHDKRDLDQLGKRNNNKSNQTK